MLLRPQGKGAYRNIRLFNFGFAQDKDIRAMHNAPAWADEPQPWQPAWTRADNHTVAAFGSTCWYAGQTLANRTNSSSPLGLLMAAVGGTQILEWAASGSLDGCSAMGHLAKGKARGKLFNTMVAPIANMSVSALLWYQVRIS